MEENKLNELMSITAEECAELTQVCMKVVRFGMNNDYKPKRPWLIEEAGDVLCMLKFMVENELVTWEELEERAEYKRNKLMKWSKLNA
jgi:NTP pyrophosphatase (non-canonical NTP hydrolase)